MSTFLCRGCGLSFSSAESNAAFCPRCRTAFADELLSLYAWMREQVAETTRRRSPAFTDLLLPTYRYTLSQAEMLRAQMLYPEWLKDKADEAREALGSLESAALRGKAAVLLATEPSRKALAELQQTLTSSADGTVIDEATVRAFYYHTRVLAYFYQKGVLDRERDFDADERLARTLFSRIAPQATPLSETDGAFGEPPAVLYEDVLAMTFGEK